MENMVVCEKLDNASYAIRLYHLAMIFYIEMKRNVYVICKKSVANQTKSCVCICVGVCNYVIFGWQSTGGIWKIKTILFH